MQEQAKPGAPFSTGTFSWNRDGDLTVTLDGAQHTTTRTYDVIGRLHSLTDGLGVTTYSYLPGTRLPTLIASPSGSIANTYDVGRQAERCASHQRYRTGCIREPKL